MSYLAYSLTSAIVVSLQHVKLSITLQEMIVLGVKNQGPVTENRTFGTLN